MKKILHVTLGNPEYKLGGVNRYCKELMNCQKADGYQPLLLYPGSFFHSKHPKITRKKENEFEINDALPVPITYGISTPERYTVASDIKRYAKWLEYMQPQIIHVHSFQGIHREFFIAARNRRIPILYTSHDYFPLCIKGVLFDRSGTVCDGRASEKCALCNRNVGLSVNTQRIIQSDLYNFWKNLKLVKKLKKNKIYDNETIVEKESLKADNDTIRCYESLHNYYLDILSCVSLIHCNSQLTYNCYKKMYPSANYVVLPITHSELHNEVHQRQNSEILNIAYMGGRTKHKGYYVLMDVFNRLEDEEDYWRLWLYGGEYATRRKSTSYMYRGFFTKEEEKEVWNHTDLLIVPSQCPETFGFVVLEALVKGIPVLCSDLVGSQDLLRKIDPSLIFHHDDTAELEIKIRRFFNQDYYKYIQQKILDVHIQSNMQLHSRRIIELYRRLIKENDD